MNERMEPTPALPGRDDIEAAAARIRGRVRVTPVVQPGAGFLDGDGELFLKLECLQHSGSFKPRGAFNRVLSQPQLPAAGLIAASGGNHGAAVAYVARELGLRAEVFVPEIAAPAKIARLRDYGATLRIGGRDYAEALAASRERRDESGALEIHAYDEFAVVAGQGTLARELEQQTGRLDTLVVAVGGGGLAAGLLAWHGHHQRVIAVEPRRSCALHAALDRGEPVDVEVAGVAADSLGARRVGDIAFHLVLAGDVRSVLVDDEAIVAAQQRLWSQLRIVAEPGGATALAALLSGVYRPRPGERVGVVICGANTDPGLVA
ncbi:MAG: threonine dehydratase [Lysobacterales bacterium 69-70]|nr:MAG: threonine dehydratase [Xanthomonadaceae bacterium SCN 69-320]ODV21680.1 MAG: threonine dehydratase [Xanthomonadaceae bacterium SCN 69-25]OJY95881.1 MAG: threonine dehydratase [Xanthomonadales bacterium 69-70]